MYVTTYEELCAENGEFHFQVQKPKGDGAGLALRSSNFTSLQKHYLIFSGSLLQEHDFLKDAASILR